MVESVKCPSCGSVVKIADFGDSGIWGICPNENICGKPVHVKCDRDSKRLKNVTNPDRLPDNLSFASQ